MWRAEADRTMRSPVLAIEALDTAPEWGRFVAAHEWAVRMVPRLHQRVVEAPLGLGTPRWSVDPQFDLRFHLRRARLPGDGGWSELLEAAAQMAMSPFERTRPPWEAVLFEGLPDGGSAYVLKMHHAFTDGLGAVSLLGRLHSDRREPRADKPQPPLRPGEQTTGLGVLGHQVCHDVASVPKLLKDIGSSAWGAVSDPVGAVRAASRYGLSLRRVLSPLDAHPSPLLAERGLAWRFAALDVPLADLRAAGRAAGGSINDAYLAALLGGYRLYHEALDAPVGDTMPMAVPVSVRRRDDHVGGNRIAGMRFCAPVGTADPRARIQNVRELLRAAKSEPAFDTIGLTSPTLARLPGTVSAQIVGSMTRGNDLQATLVPGGRPGQDRYLAGGRIERVYPFAPLPGCPAMVIMVTHGDIGCVGVNFDLAAITRPEVFLRCLVDGFAEVLSLHPGSAAPTLRT